VTYAPFLLDPQKRPAWVKEVGWQTVDDVEKESVDKFEDIALAEIDKAVSNL
jgi:hypothetical protein